MNPTVNNLLTIEQLSLSVRAGHLIPERKRVLHDVSFAVPRGKATAYLGPNGVLEGAVSIITGQKHLWF